MFPEDTLKEITIKAAKNASKSFAKIAGLDICVDVVCTHFLKFQKDTPVFDLEERVVGVFMPISGDIIGAALLVFSEGASFTCLDRLFKRESVGRHQLTEIEKSALKEVCNILCGSFLTTFSDTLNIRVIENIPNLKIDMYGAIVDHLITQFAHKSEDVLFVEVKLIMSHTEVIEKIILLFAFDQMTLLFEKINGLDLTGKCILK